LYKPRLMETEVLRWLDRGFSVVLVGPRQAGKTTLIKHLAESTGGVYLTLDDPDVLEVLSDVKAFTDTYLSGLNGKKILYLDEAQYDRRFSAVEMMLRQHLNAAFTITHVGLVFGQVE